MSLKGLHDLPKIPRALKHMLIHMGPFSYYVIMEGTGGSLLMGKVRESWHDGIYRQSFVTHLFTFSDPITPC